jgi:hypothetical protein
LILSEGHGLGEGRIVELLGKHFKYFLVEVKKSRVIPNEKWKMT